MSEWFKSQRQGFIDATLSQFGQINRDDIVREFGVSVITASADISTYLASTERSVRYDTSAKVYTTDALCTRPGTAQPQSWPAWTVLMMKPDYWRSDESCAADEVVRLWLCARDPESAADSARFVLPSQIEGVGQGEDQADPEDFAVVAIFPGRIKDLHKGEAS